jgi:hypothetical protein
MIYETLQIIKEQLEAFLEEEGFGKIVLLDNIALWQSGSDDASRIDGKVVLTLLKLEEESTLRNSPSVQVVDGRTEYRNPEINLNLYLLISANCDTYDKSLSAISKTIQLFQGRNNFTKANTVYKQPNMAFEDIGDFRFVLDLYTPTFEELNNIWGSLGGRQLPSVIYRVQLIRISSDKASGAGSVITRVKGNLNDFE